jgi:hypothetical protein
MSALLKTQSREIGGRNYQIRLLSFDESRQVYSKIQRLLSANEEVLEETGLGFFMFAGLAGGVSDEDLKLYCSVFGEATTVEMGPNMTLSLKDAGSRTAVFSGQFEDVFEWLDACVAINFGGVIAKMRAARLHQKAWRAAKAEPTT